MKILHLMYDHTRNPWAAGGGAVRAYEIYSRLACRHQITLVCGKYSGAKDYEEGNVKIHFEGTESSNYPLSTFCYAISAGNFLRKHHMDYDVVIEDFAPWNPLFSFRVNTDTPVILQIQNYLGKEILKKYNIGGLPFYLVEKYYPLRFRNTVVVNKSLAARYGLPHAYSLSNGIDDDLLKVDLPAGRDYIAYLGRIDIHQKGLDILSGAMKGLSAKLKVAGDGRDRKRFLRMLKNRGNIEWVGSVKGEEKIAFLGNAQFLVAPSRFEGQGIVVLEAAACGKPVIVSDIPELSYAVDAGFALSFRTGDPRDLADKIRFLLGNQSLRKEMGRKAREYAGKFTWDRIAAEYETFLNNICDGRAAGKSRFAEG